MKTIRREIDARRLDLNEADTRFHLIDRILIECLGWPKSAFRLEQAHERTFSDYELGVPRRVIWEAKREGRAFALPANPKKKLISDLPSLLALGGETEEAIRQVQRYCADRGVEVAVATNGHQFIAFLATRSDGMAPLNGKCFVIDGLAQLYDEFPNVWQALSPEGVEQRKLAVVLNLGEDRGLAPKLKQWVPHYPQYNEPSPLEASLRTVGELLLLDFVERPDVEKRFMEECYCTSGALSQHALLSKQLLAARYSSLFNPKEASPSIIPAIAGKGKQITPEMRAEALSQRPIVLIGDVGVGKTSFLKHLMYVTAEEEFKDALYVHIDLGSQGALETDLHDFVLSEVESQLRTKYKVDVEEESFVTAVYSLDIQRFKKGIYGRLERENHQLYTEKLLEFLAEKTRNKASHLKESVRHVALGRKKNVVITIDNADQRNAEIQNEAFIIAQSFAKEWRAAVFVALWPQTFFKSKQSGALAAYTHRVFTIAPPRVDEMLSKRLRFALNMAEGRVPVQHLKDVGLRLENIALVLQALLNTLQKSSELNEFLGNITGGNVRRVIDIISNFIGNPNIDAAEIVDKMAHGTDYEIPMHSFWKAFLLGDFFYFDEPSSLALNLFDTQAATPNEHFLCPMILGFLHTDGAHRSKEGFVEASAITTELQNWGFSLRSTEASIRRLNNKKLIESPQRVTFDEDSSGLMGDVDGRFRISTIGAYHLMRLISEMTYLDAMSYDTPIFDEAVRERLIESISSLALEDRYERAKQFKTYLTNLWDRSRLKPGYFNWHNAMQVGAQSFKRVAGALERRALA